MIQSWLVLRLCSTLCSLLRSHCFKSVVFRDGGWWWNRRLAGPKKASNHWSPDVSTNLFSTFQTWSNPDPRFLFSRGNQESLWISLAGFGWKAMPEVWKPISCSGKRTKTPKKLLCRTQNVSNKTLVTWLEAVKHQLWMVSHFASQIRSQRVSSTTATLSVAYEARFPSMILAWLKLNLMQPP